MIDDIGLNGPARILVIKLGALGDFVLAFHAFASIRAHHPGAHITLLTRAPLAELGRRAPWFEQVEVEHKTAWWNLPGLLRLRRQLSGYDFVYDLQTSSRTGWYFRLAGRPSWCGIARGASHRHTNPRRDFMHTIERQRDQLAQAGIIDVARPDLSWLEAGGPELPEPYAVLVPGASPHRPRKRWPAERFGALAARLWGQGILPVIVGATTDQALAAAILRVCPTALDLTGRTSLVDLAGLSFRAAFCVGNDTGPTHLAAAMGCPTVVLFSEDSDPALTAPVGRWPGHAGQVAVLRTPDLADLPLERVAAALP